MHVGWENETLLDLFAYYHNPDLNFWYVGDSSDCTKVIPVIRVQPHWRYLLERIKCGQDPDAPAQDSSEAQKTDIANLGSIVEATSSWGNLAPSLMLLKMFPVLNSASSCPNRSRRRKRTTRRKIRMGTLRQYQFNRTTCMPGMN